MRGFLAIVLCLGGMLSASGAEATVLIDDGGFESQGASSPGSFCYFPGCATGSWTSIGQSGLQYEFNSAWPGTATPDGSYYGFIQNEGVLSQTFTLGGGGNFVLTWLDAGRPSSGSFNGDQTYEVTITGASTPTLYSGSTTSYQAFTARTSAVFHLGAGSHTLSFSGLTTGDHTAFIDAVSLQATAAPEPSGWALFILGFGVLGAAMRRRGRVIAAAA